MYEKVSKYHPDKLADRIAGALVDLAYSKVENPKVAIELLLGHQHITIINETNVHFADSEILKIVNRIITNKSGAQISNYDYIEKAQDEALAANQKEELRCGDNGIFRGFPTTPEEKALACITKAMDKKFGSDGKYILDTSDNSLIVCQSNASTKQLTKFLRNDPYNLIINPLGEWTGGIDVDTGAINRKLGSDLGESVTGGGIHGKDLSKADVSITIVCKLLAKQYNEEVKAKCAIGDADVTFTPASHESINMPFTEVVKRAHQYIKEIGGFEKLAEYGLVR